MKCRKCKLKLKDVPVGFDALSFLTPIKMMYCDNKECDRYGDVTVAGLPEDKINICTH